MTNQTQEQRTPPLSPARLRMPGKANTVKVLLSVAFVALVLVPLVRMFLYIDADSFRKVVASPNFLTSIINSVVAASLSTVITLALAYLLAVSIERTNIRFKRLFGILFVLPMLIPSISNGMGLVILFGNNGIITRLLGLEGSIYGLQGLVLGSVLYAFPVAYLMLVDVMKYEDYAPYEAASVLGIPRVRQFSALTLPYLRKPLISIVFAIFTLIVTDYGVPLMVGGKFITIPVVMYQEVIGQLNFGKGAVYGSLLLVPAISAFIIDLVNKDRASSKFVSKPFEPANGRLTQAFAYLSCTVMAIFTALPLVSFVTLGFTEQYPAKMWFSLRNIENTLNLRANVYLRNSVVIALLVSVIGVVVAFLTAYMSARMKSKASRFLHFSAITSAAIPGVVLGLAYVLVFKGTAIYGTLAILVMVNIVHFVSSPYLMMYNSLSKVNENLEHVGQTLGVGRALLIRDVIIPQCRGTLLEMFSYFFVNCMMTISAVSFLATTANKPISLMINQFEAQMQIENAAVVSLAILVVNLLVKGVIALLKNLSVSGKAAWRLREGARA